MRFRPTEEGVFSDPSGLFSHRAGRSRTMRGMSRHDAHAPARPFRLIGASLALAVAFGVWLASTGRVAGDGDVAPSTTSTTAVAATAVPTTVGATREPSAAGGLEASEEPTTEPDSPAEGYVDPPPGSTAAEIIQEQIRLALEARGNPRVVDDVVVVDDEAGAP